MKKSKLLLLLGTIIGSALLLSGCDYALLDPKGLIGVEERALILKALFLMLIVVIPVIIMVIAFAWHYRASNTNAKYDPYWSHSVKLEIIWWAIPIIIVTLLSILAWKTSHSLDPFKPLESKKKPLVVEVVSLDWKWLFILPKQGIASVNHLEVPVDVPLNFHITSDAPMNSFWVPRLGGQIYSMAGMRTKLHLIANHAGTYDGVSANLSGEGFTGMRFTITAGSQNDFNRWVSKVKAKGQSLTWRRYTQLAKPTQNNPVEYFSSVKKGLFDDIMMKYMMPAKSHSTQA